MMLLIGGSVLALVLVLLTVDWIQKRKRVASKSETSPERFSVAGDLASYDHEDVLRVRALLAKELSLPADKLAAGDRLAEIRDRYCPVVVGHLAMSDLDDFLDEQIQKSGLDRPGSWPETVGEFVSAYLTHEQAALSAVGR